MASALREHFIGLDPPSGQTDVEKQQVEGEFVFRQPTTQGGFLQCHKKALSSAPTSLPAGQMKPGPQQPSLENIPGCTALWCSDAFCALQMIFTKPGHKAAPNKIILTSFLTPRTLVSFQAVVYTQRSH